MSAYLENSKDDLELKTQILQLFSNFTTLAPQISKICNIVHFSGFLSKYQEAKHLKIEFPNVFATQFLSHPV